MDLISKKAGRQCVICKHWNGAVGSTTIQPKNMGNTFAFDHNEKQQCFKYCRLMPSYGTCAGFESRYK